MVINKDSIIKNETVQTTFEVVDESATLPSLTTKNIDKIHPLIGMESTTPYEFM